MNRGTYLILRLSIGVSMLGHGLARLPKLAGFSHWMTTQFAHSWLPYALVKPFSLVLPVAEFTIGLLLITGLFTRAALVAGSVVMGMLIFGSCIIENWEVLVSQLVHTLFFAVLLQFLPANSRALDSIFRSSASAQ